MSSISMSDFGKWDEAHARTPVAGEFVLQFRQDLLRCDECGGQADTLNLINSNGEEGGVGDVRDVRVKFSCENHPAGGYEVDFPRLFGGLGERSFLTHIAEKNWGLFAMAELREKLSEIAHESQIADGYRKVDEE